MPILKRSTFLLGRKREPAARRGCWHVVTACLLALVLTGCKKDVATDAINSDANGYLCLTCGVKLYTARSVFIGPQCPKCQKETLMDVIGYYCEKDQHLTIRPRRGDNQPIVCDVCRQPLVNAMRAPREKELKAWGATKTSS